MRFTRLPILVVIQRFSVQVLAQIDLGTAASFGVFASSAVTNTGNTIVTGDLGLFPNTQSSITGFPPGLSGTVHAGDGVANQALLDAKSAYDAASSLAPTSQIAGTDLGGQRLVAGTYTSVSSVLITGTLTLDGQNNPEALFVFQIGSTLTTASSSSIVLVNGARACNIFFQIGSSATLGSSTTFNGNILALTSISLSDDVSVNGGLYALNGAVTLINDQIASQPRCVAVASSIVPADPSSTLAGTSTEIMSITQTLSQEASSIIPVDAATMPPPSETTLIPIPSSTSTSLGQSESPDVPVVPDVPVTLTVPEVPGSIMTPDAPDTPVIPNTSTTPSIPVVPVVSRSSDRFSMGSSTNSIDSVITSSSRVSTSFRFLSVPATSTGLTRSSDGETGSTRSLSTHTTSTASLSTRTASTASTSGSRSSRLFKSSSFSTPIISTGSKPRTYPVYTSTGRSNSTMTTHLSSRTYYRQTHTASEATKTSTAPVGTSMINGTPCTTLSYYEATCDCTQTTVVPIAYTPGPTFKTADLFTVSGVPCTTTQYYEEACDCIRTSKVPIKAVSATVNIDTVINGVPYVTSKYLEPACNCVQTTTVPVRIMDGDESIETTAEAICAETHNVLSFCIAAYMQPSAPTATSLLQ